MSTRKISTLPEFIEWASQFNKEEYIFRGVSKKSYDINSSSYRDLLKPGRDLFRTDLSWDEKLLLKNMELIREATREGHHQKDGRWLSDLELLAELQHFDVPTCLIDFTYNPQIALWFACQKSKSEQEQQEDGKVIALRYVGVTGLKEVTPELLPEKIEHFFKEDIFYYWRPSHQNKRILTQQSIFVFGRRAPKIESDEVCIVKEGNKGDILEYLDNVSGITDGHIYPDIEGFIRLRKRDPSLRGRTVQEYLRLANQEIVNAMQEIRDRYNQEAESAEPNITTHSHLNLAISYCNRAIEMLRDGSIHADNFTIARAYYTRGFAYNLIDKSKIESAIADYSRAIELDPNHREAHFNRGLIWVEEEQWDNAKSDFTKARALGFDLSGYFNGLGGMNLFEPRIVNKMPEDIKELLMQP